MIEESHHKTLGEHLILLTQWGLVTHICGSKQRIIGSDKGWSPGRRQAIIWTNAVILLIDLKDQTSVKR